MAMNIELPLATATDPSDVVLALETAHALWRSGESKDALKWLRRAAETAEAEGDDMRALSLARAAAELTDLLPAEGTVPSPARPSSLPTSAPLAAELMARAPEAPPAAPVVAAPEVAPKGPPPLPSSPNASPSPASSPKASAPPASSPKAAPPPASVKPSVAPASAPVTSHPMRSLEPAPTPISSLAAASRPPPPPVDSSSPEEAITPVPAMPDPGLRASSLARPFETAPVGAPFPPPHAHAAEAPTLAHAPADELASSARQALRVVVEVLSRDSGTFLVRIIDEGDAPPSRGHEALLVPLVPGIDLRAT
jgi:hypothetical protein